jgi:hypothetical protein
LFRVAFGLTVAVVAGVVVVVFGVVAFTVAGTARLAAGIVFIAAPPGLPDVGVVVAGVVAGSTVIGVGNGGSGLASTPAIISFRPASDPVWRYLYQVLSASIQPGLLAW